MRRKLLSPWCVLAAAMFLAPSTAAAQAATPVAVGLNAPFAAVIADRTVASPFGTVASPFVQHDARRTRWREGAAIGFVVGAGATFALLATSNNSGYLCSRDRDDDAIGWRACTGIALGAGVATGAIGALIGSRIPTR